MLTMLTMLTVLAVLTMAALHQLPPEERRLPTVEVLHVQGVPPMPPYGYTYYGHTCCGRTDYGLTYYAVGKCSVCEAA